ncbi:MAG: hypothetical protein ACKV2Q_00195 [Planctomycetaceae bacterium]
MRFAYKSYEIPKSPLDGSTEIFRPEIVVHLIGSTDDIYALGLVDCGADSVVIGSAIAQRIGIRLNHKHRWTIHGFAGQSLEATLGHVEVEVSGRTESFCWSLPVAVVKYPETSNEELVVLGQTGFLEYFDVRLFGDEHVVELKPNASFPKKRRRSAK